MKIDLLPKEYRPQAPVSVPRLAFALFIALTLFGTTLLLFSDWLRLSQTNADLLRVEQRLQLYGRQYQEVMTLERRKADIQKKKQELAAIIEPYIPIDRFLSEIIRPLPDNVWLSSINIDEAGKIAINGRSDRLRAVAIYMMDLESSPAFVNTKLQSINNPTGKGAGDIFNFNMTFEVEKAGLKK